jgi:2-octaprenyl-6-methoxyphenol hydroxylase
LKHSWQNDQDIIIIGGAMTGAAFACSPALSQYKVTVIDQNAILPVNTQTGLDGRKIALSYGSQKILNYFGVWEQLEKFSTPIHSVHISQEKYFGALHLSRELKEWDALGYVISAEIFTATLQGAAYEKSNVTWIEQAMLKNVQIGDRPSITFSQNGEEKTIHARLIIAADGTQSFARELVGIETKTHDYHQTALVTSVELSESHQNTAYERFLSQGALAFLPMQGKTGGIVLMDSPGAIKSLMLETDEGLLEILQEKLGYRLGKLKKLGQRFTYPIKRVIANTQIAPNFLLLGNSAHTLSPIGAQGFNLTLQDMLCFSQRLKKYELTDPELLKHYEADQVPYQKKIIAVSEKLMQYSIEHQILNGIGLSLADMNDTVKVGMINLMAGVNSRVKAL